jgi:hypothetical protein
MGLQPLAYWNCGFESRRRPGVLSLVNVVCYQVDVSAKSRSLVQSAECDEVQQSSSATTKRVMRGQTQKERNNLGLVQIM